MLKFGLALIQHTNYSIPTDAVHLLLKKTVMHDRMLKYLLRSVKYLHYEVKEHRRMSNRQFRHLHDDLEEVEEDVDDIEDCLEDYKEDTEPEIDEIRDSTRCGGHGWTQVAHLDFSDSNVDCPPPLVLHTGDGDDGDIRTCGRSAAAGDVSCDSITFPVNKVYQRVCGKIIAFQFGAANGFSTTISNLEGAYVSGVSLTYGAASSRNHIWTFAAGRAEGDRNDARSCPCDFEPGFVSDPPDFLGNEFFCESGVNGPYDDGAGPQFFDDHLWNGKGCEDTSKCCDFNAPPFFIKDFHTAHDENIELRLCGIDAVAEEDIRIKLIKLFVQ